MVVPSEPNAPDATRVPSGITALFELAPAKPPGAAVKPRIGGLEGKPTAEVLIALALDVASFWQSQFNAAKLEFKPATMTVVKSGSHDTACGTFNPESAPNYCAKDTSLTYPVTWFDQNAAPIGDFAIAYPVAIMWGLHIEHLLGVDAKLPVEKRWLLASCLVGNWAASVYQRRALEEDDLAEGAELISKLPPPGSEPQAHLNAFNAGFSQGNAGSCAGFGS
jgi:predicted metalloprotease